MKRLLIILFFLPFLANGPKMTNRGYYFAAVANGGNDANGCTLGAPCLTMTKASSLSPASGDSILIHGGDMLTGSLIMPASSIYIGSYGGGKGGITGLLTLSSPTSLGGTVYEYSVPGIKATCGIVLVNGVQYHKGRYPNSGWLIYTAHSGSSSITDLTLPDLPSFVGYSMAIRLVNYVTDIVPVTSQASGVVGYTCSSCFGATNGYGYFFEGLAPDTVGEYQKNPTSDSLIIDLPGAPSGYVVQATTTDTLISANGKAGVTIDNIALTGGNVYGYYNSGSANTIKNCAFSYIGRDGVGGAGTTNLHLQRDTIAYCNNDGIDLGGGSNSDTVANCYIRQIGMIDGMNASGQYRMCGIVAVGNYNSVDLNRIDTVGYDGIAFGGDSTRIRYNYINYYCSKKDDGGGIYCNTGVTVVTNKQREITGNICMNGVGAPAGKTGSNILIAMGIYADQNTSQMTIRHNSLYNNYTAGFNCGGNHLISFDSNNIVSTLTSTRTAGIQILSGTSSPVRNIHMTGNVVSVLAGAKVFYCETFTGDTITKWGVIDSNYYCSTGGSYQVYLNPTFTTYTYPQWITLTGTEGHSALTRTADQFAVNTSTSVGLSTFPGQYNDVLSNKYNTQISLSGRSSAILFYLNGGYTLYPVGSITKP